MLSKSGESVGLNSWPCCWRSQATCKPNILCFDNTKNNKKRGARVENAFRPLSQPEICDTLFTVNEISHKKKEKEKNTEQKVVSVICMRVFVFFCLFVRVFM